MKILITGRSVQVTDGIREKIHSMLLKHKKFLKSATKIEVELREPHVRANDAKNVRVEISVSMPKVIIRVEENGKDFYSLIDEMDPVLRRRLVRYHDHIKQWEESRSWKSAAREVFEKELKEIKEDVYADIQGEPTISRYKQFSQNSPMHPAEAIERMELLGHQAFLFRNIETRKYSVVYRRNDGTYGLVEPKDG